MKIRLSNKDFFIINFFSMEKKMKKFMFVSMMVFVLFMVACGSEPQRSAGNSATPATGQNPFGPTFKTPCEMYDDDEWFAATGIYAASSKQKGVVLANALAAAQREVRMKVQHAYKGMVSDFMESVGNNKGNDVEQKLTQAGDQIIDKVINDTQAKCREFGAVQADGDVEAYVGIRIRKKELSEKITENIKNKLSDEEKMKVKFDEEEYRKKMDERFEKFKEGQN